MSKTIRIIYILVILLLFGVAGTLGAFCIHYDRVPEGIIIIGSAVVVLVVSIIVALSGSVSKDDKSMAKQKAKANNVPSDAKVLMTLKGTVQTYSDGNITSEPIPATVKMYDKFGIHIFIDKKNKLLKYEKIEDIYKETDNDFVLGMSNGIEYKVECESLVKLMAFEDILNKQTNYRFDADDEDDD